MNLITKITALFLCIFLLNAAEFSQDQIIEFWQPKREFAYFAAAANFDPKIRLVFDLRKQNIIDNFYEIRHLPIVVQNIRPGIANVDSDTDDYFNCNEITLSHNQTLQPISVIQKVLNFVKSIFY